MEDAKTDNENQYNNSDLLATDSSIKTDKENVETYKSKPETSNTSSYQNTNENRGTNSAECVDMQTDKVQENISLKSQTDNGSVKEDRGEYSFECIDFNDCQTIENENQAESPKIRSANSNEIGNAWGETSDSLHTENSHQSVFDYKEQPFNTHHLTSVKRQQQDIRKGASKTNSSKTRNYRQPSHLSCFGRVSERKGDVLTGSMRPTIGQATTAQVIPGNKDQRDYHYEGLGGEQKEENTKQHYGTNSSSTNSTHSSVKLKVSDKRKLGEKHTAHEDTLSGATTSKAYGTVENVPGTSEENRPYHSSKNSGEGHQKGESKSTVSSAFTTTDIKNSLDDSKDNSFETERNSEDMFGSENAPVRANEGEPLVNCSLVRNYAESNKQIKYTACANSEKLNRTEDEATAPEAESIEITNENVPMQEYKEEQDKTGDSLTEYKNSVSDKEEVDIRNKTTSNIDKRNKYKNRNNCNGSQSDTSSAFATIDNKNNFVDDSKNNLFEAVRKPKDMFVRENNTSVIVNKVEQAVNYSLAINYAETNEQNENIVRANPEKLNTEDQATAPETESLKLTPKEITNQNAPMLECKEEHDKTGDSLTENKKRVANKEEVDVRNKTSNMNVRNKYKNTNNGNDSHSNINSENQNLIKDSSSEFREEINTQIPQVNNTDDNAVISGGYQHGSANKNTIHSLNSYNLEYDGTSLGSLGNINTSTQSEENLKEKSICISDYSECQKCSKKELTIFKLLTQTEDLKIEILKKDSHIKQLEQENSEKDLKESQKKTFEMEETNKNFKESDEECKSAIESLLKDLSIKKSPERSGLWNLLIANKHKDGKDGAINAINQIKSYIQKLQAKIIEQQNETEKDIIINTYVQELRNCYTQYENLETKHKMHLKILEDKDREVYKLKQESNKNEKYYTEKFNKLFEEIGKYKNQLKECKLELNYTLTELKAKDKQNVAEFNSVLNAQIDINEKLQLEKNKLESESKSKILTLENFLQETKIGQQKFQNKYLTLESELDQERKKTKTFKKTLENLKRTLKKEESDLQPQNEALEEHLNRISNTIQHVCKPVSQEENAMQTDEPFINNALERIRKIHQDVNNYEDQVREFEGNSQSKTYLHIKDILVRTVLQLNSVPNKRKEKIVKSQKEVRTRIKCLIEELKQMAQQ